MNKQLAVAILFFFLLLFAGGFSASAQEPLVYDEAGLLTSAQREELEAFAESSSAEHGVKFLFLTTTSTGGLPIRNYMGNFFDERAEATGDENAVLLTIDIGGRDLYLAGFGTAEQRLGDKRIDLVLDRIMPNMRSGDYGGAFEKTITLSNEYMHYTPGVNPESIFLKTWFHLLAALALAGGIVGSMVFNIGGRITTNSGTYIDRDNTRVRNHGDRFRNKTVTRSKVPQNKGGGGGFGGGGTTGGGRSFSGGGRSF